MRRMTFAFLSPIHKASRQIGRYLEGACGREGIGTAEGHLLSYLRSYAPCSIATLLEIFGMKPSTATSMLQRLVDQGQIRREESPEDRRVVLIRLTRKGAASADRLRRVLAGFEAAVRSRAGDRDVEGFKVVMAAIEDVTRVPAGKESQP
ncbi:MAG: MarR family winged helix-turn-helix transcriptional regulator [Candidatus Eiseniibacteriota bacterium]